MQTRFKEYQSSELRESGAVRRGTGKSRGRGRKAQQNDARLVKEPRSGGPSGGGERRRQRQGRKEEDTIDIGATRPTKAQPRRKARREVDSYKDREREAE